MEISREGDFYQSHSRKDFPHCEIGERRGSVNKYALDCYTMANSTNVIYSYVCWFECCTHFYQQMSHFMNFTNRCLIIWTKEWVKKVTGLKRRQEDGFSGLLVHSSFRTISVPPTNLLHNLYETGLSSASSIGIIWGIKHVWRSLYRCN